MTTQSVVNVLLVEDEPKLRASLIEGLQLEEWRVAGAGSGVEALRYIETESFDLIVLDWLLPDGDGLEIVRRLRALRNPVPILMITARVGDASRELARQSGVNDFLAKPFAFDELLARARALLTRQ